MLYRIVLTYLPCIVAREADVVCALFDRLSTDLLEEGG